MNKIYKSSQFHAVEGRYDTDLILNYYKKIPTFINSSLSGNEEPENKDNKIINLIENDDEGNENDNNRTVKVLNKNLNIKFKNKRNKKEKSWSEK